MVKRGERFLPTPAARVGDAAAGAAAYRLEPEVAGLIRAIRKTAG